jgi:tetratricopeptide (TPR) repeat protein
MSQPGNPVNPYVAGNPLKGEKGFFGRQDILEWVTQELRNPGTNALVLSGQRRIGKTTLLRRLEDTLPQDRFLPIYFDLQDQAGHPLGQVLFDLVDTITGRNNSEFFPPKSFDDRGRFFCDTFLPQLYQTLGENCRLVLLLDEFDVLDKPTERELPEKAAAKALFPFLRRLMGEDPRLAFVFVVGRRTDDLSVDFTTTFKGSLVREIWVLDRASAKSLVLQAEANNTLRFTDQAVERILSLTNGHPYLTQLLCQRIWERAYTEQPTTPPMIDIQEVDRAVADALETGKQALTWLWDGLSPAEKIYASALAEAADEEKEVISEDQVIRVLTANAPRLRTREVEMAPHDLVKRRVLEKEVSREGEYHFAVELFRRWVRQNKPLRDVKNELDRIDPLAEEIFNVGHRMFRKREWEGSVRYFQDALKINPHHIHARLHLGEALLELEQTSQAVIELEMVYKQEQEQSRLPLARALIAHAKVQQQKENEAEALNACERALEISPNEQEARAIRTAIWVRRRNLALERNAIDDALEAHQKANSEQAEEVLDFFQQVLAKNPQHWKKVVEYLQQISEKSHDQSLFRSKLVQILLQVGQIDEAVTELKKIYDINQTQARQLFPVILEAQAQTAPKTGELLDFCIRVMEIDSAYPDALEMMKQAVTNLRQASATNIADSQNIQGEIAQFPISPQIRSRLDKAQLYQIMSAATDHVRLLGVVALNADWETLAPKWKTTIAGNPNFEITVLCESDNMLFSKSFTYDTNVATNRRSFEDLKFIRDRAMHDFPESLHNLIQDKGKIEIEIMHLPIPISIVQVDNRIFANLWLHEVDEYFEEITQNHPWHALLEKYVATYFNREYGRKYACTLKDEMLELFDHERISRGIYPRDSFYDTDYSQLVVWAFVFDRQGRLLIHRRADNAKDNQGMWDKSVGGHIDFESDPDMSHAALREVIEELYSDEMKQGKSGFIAVSDKEMVNLGEWRPNKRRRFPFHEIRTFDREWAFFKLQDSQHLYSPRTLSDGRIRRLRVIADVFLFVASPKLIESSLGSLKNSTFKLIELSELKDAMDRALRKEEVHGFDETNSIPAFTPDLINIMTGNLRGTLEEFSQYIKKYINS